jgi:hypothetical protein
MVRPASEPPRELCNLAMPTNILRRLEPASNHGV